MILKEYSKLANSLGVLAGRGLFNMKGHSGDFLLIDVSDFDVYKRPHPIACFFTH